MPRSTQGGDSLWLPGFGLGDPAIDPPLPPAPRAPAPTETFRVEQASPPAATQTVEHRPRWHAAIDVDAHVGRAPDWPAWDDRALDHIEGQATKFDANLEAISTLRAIERDGRSPTAVERAALLRYTGWGGIPAAFNEEARDALWRDRAHILRNTLDADDHESAKASVNNSHYTDPVLVHWIWSLLSRLGFRGGAVLEPSAGIGHFVGCMPPSLVNASRITAIELDRVSGRILHALYAPHGVDVRIAGFEATPIPDESIDLVVSNVPFGNYRVRDGRNRPYSRASIHNWFVGRALDVVRPGGLVCVITSTYLLDGWRDAMRAHVASVADLVTAFRLPSGCFERLASTSVQADLVVLRKRADGHAADEPTWLDDAVVPDELRHPRCFDRHLRINRWFVDHPDHVIGTIDRISNGFEPVATAVFDGDLPSALRLALDHVPEGVVGPPAAIREVAAPRVPTTAAPTGARPGAFLLHEGRISVVEGARVLDVHDSFNAAARHRVAGMIEIRDRARALLRAQLDDISEAQLDESRRSLNAAYDRFTAKHGWLSSRANANAFRRDPDYPLLLSLEHFDDEKEAATKADIFFRRTVAPVREPEHAAEPDEALALSLQWRGKVDAAYMGALLRAEPTAVIDDLVDRGMIYLDPESGAHEPADAYLSGDVKRKLQLAIAAGPDFEANVVALEKVIPEDLPPASIEPRLGAVWIPADVIEAFVAEVLKLDHVEVRYLALAGAWSIAYNDWSARQSVACIQEFGTLRMHALELIQQALNVQTPTVRDPHPEKDGAYVVNKNETLAAREKLATLKERFAGWAYQDQERRKRLCRIYNDTFNRLRPRVFDGSHLRLPGFSRCFELLRSQRDAIWRIVQSGNTGLFHAVGAGKTAIMVCASMEMKRLGLAHKPVHVVPNHCLMQYTAEWVRLYPGASVLMATKDDLAGDRRREFAARVATGAWDGIVMTHSTFELLSMSAGFTKRFIESIIRELEMSVRAAKSDTRSNRIVKELERMKKLWKLRLEQLDNRERKDSFLDWEALGIDLMFIDEAHLHKNLWRHTKMTRVAGLPLANSQRAFDLYLKTRHTMSLYQNEHRGVILATATPVANSMAEIHVFQRYLQPKTLRALGLEQFDAWAATFGETVTALEIAPDGSGYRLNTRFARFVNVPDLMGVFCDVSDVRTQEMLDLPVPKLRGGKPRTVTCEPSAELKAFVQTLVERAEKLRTTRVDPKVDNMLLIANEGRMAALDMRLIGNGYAADPRGKVAQCATETHAIWQRTASLRRAQLVFCDLSTPKGGEVFSVYEALKDALIARGIPSDEIAFVHDAGTDAQKAKLFRSVRSGKVRVLLGSTSKMGVGTNVQTRLVALHELDCPWRPCDVEQREGRILRQGNECGEVEVIRYVTEGSFDAYSWQTLLVKARFIAQVMSGDKGLRSVEDVEVATLSYAEVKALASGNPKIIEKAGVDAEVAKYASLYSVWRNQRYKNQDEAAQLPLTIQSLEKFVSALRCDAAAAAAVLQGDLEVKVHGRALRGREAIGEALRAALKSVRERIGRQGGEVAIGQTGDLELVLFVGCGAGDAYLVVKGRARHDCAPRQTALALHATLVDTLQSIGQRHRDAEHRLEHLRRKLAALGDELARPFEHDARLKTLRARQRELDRELDLAKDDLGTAGLDAQEDKLAA